MTSPYPPLAMTSGISYCIFDDSPFNYVGSDMWTTDPGFETLPEAVQQAMVHLNEHDFDNGRCSACDEQVGWALHGDADEYTRWHWTTAVTDGEKVWLVCEGCTTALAPLPEPVTRQEVGPSE